MTEVIPNLFIGNWQEAKKSSLSGMYVITVAVDSPYVGNEHFKLIDGPGNQRETFDSAVDSVVKAFSEGKRVMVHCVGGRSRSGAVLCKSVARILGKNICEAYDMIAARHDPIRIHPALSEFVI